MLRLGDPRFGDPAGLWVNTPNVRWHLRDVADVEDVRLKCRTCHGRVSRFYLEFQRPADAVGLVYCSKCWLRRLAVIPMDYLTDDVRKFLDAAEAYLIEKALTS